MLAGQIARLRPSLVLPKDPMICSSVNPARFMSVLWKGRTLAPHGGKTQGQVTLSRSVLAAEAVQKLLRRTPGRLVDFSQVFQKLESRAELAVQAV